MDSHMRIVMQLMRLDEGSCILALYPSDVVPAPLGSDASRDALARSHCSTCATVVSFRGSPDATVGPKTPGTPMRDHCRPAPSDLVSCCSVPRALKHIGEVQVAWVSLMSSAFYVLACTGELHATALMSALVRTSQICPSRVLQAASRDSGA